ncbi:MAG TPA: hypothetical protein PKW15_02465, partial [Alphaproteobacteria bacterium]|nr:hypothetical protein [Alphaproteobacteria bacterium]
HGNDSELLGHYTIENERLLIPLSKQFGSFYAPQSGGRLTEKLIVALHREHYSRYGHNLTILDEPLALEIAETMNSEVVYAVAKHLFDTTGVQVNILEIGPGPKPLKLDGVDPGIVAGYFGLDLDTANYVRLPGSGRVPESRIFYSDLSVMPVDGATLITGRGIGHFLSDEHAELVWRHLSSGGQPIVMIFPDHPWMARENPLVKKARKNGMTIESVARVPFKIICVGSQNLSEVIAPVADRAIDRMIDLERSFGDGKTSAVVP